MLKTIVGDLRFFHWCNKFESLFTTPAQKEQTPMACCASAFAQQQHRRHKTSE